MKIGAPYKTPEIIEDEPQPIVEEPALPEPLPEKEPVEVEDDTLKDITVLLEKVNGFEKEKADLIQKHKEEMTAVKAAIKKAIYGDENQPPTKE